MSVLSSYFRMVIFFSRDISLPASGRPGWKTIPSRLEPESTSLRCVSLALPRRISRRPVSPRLRFIGDWPGLQVASCIPPYQSHGLAAARRTRARIVSARTRVLLHRDKLSVIIPRSACTKAGACTSLLFASEIWSFLVFKYSWEINVKEDKERNSRDTGIDMRSLVLLRACA